MAASGTGKVQTRPRNRNATRPWAACPSPPRLLRTFCKFATSTFWIYLSVSRREGCLAGPLRSGEPFLSNGKEQPAARRFPKTSEPEHGLQALSSAGFGHCLAEEWEPRKLLYSKVPEYSLPKSPLHGLQRPLGPFCTVMISIRSAVLQSTFAGLAGGYSQRRSLPLQPGKDGPSAPSWGRGGLRLLSHPPAGSRSCPGAGTVLDPGGAEAGSPCQGPVPPPGHGALEPRSCSPARQEGRVFRHCTSFDACNFKKKINSRCKVRGFLLEKTLK